MYVASHIIYSTGIIAGRPKFGNSIRWKFMMQYKDYSFARSIVQIFMTGVEVEQRVESMENSNIVAWLN